MHIIPNTMSLPFFMLTRRRLKTDQLDRVRTLIKKKRATFLSECEKDSEEKCKFKFLNCNLKTSQPPCAIYDPIKKKHDRSHVSPNVYNTQKMPFENKKGSYGAYWRKLSAHKPLKRSDTQSKFPRNLDTDHTNVHRFTHRRGVFLENARKRRAVIRCMIADLAGCERDPKEPGPNNYFPQNHTISYNASPIVKRKPPETYIYLKNSSVPEKPNSIHKKKRLGPDPTSYENRFTHVTGKVKGLIYQPGLQIMIDAQKRRRFRRQSYKPIKEHYYYAPDFDHVRGHGFTYLFSKQRPNTRMSAETERLLLDKEKKKQRLFLKPLQLYAGQRYIQMITNPNRKKISFREKGSYFRKPPSIKFAADNNKVFIQHNRLKVSRKRVAFNSSQNRFDYDEKPKPLKPNEICQIRKSLPFELRVRNYPIMTKKPNEIHSKLKEIPERFILPKGVNIEKRLFKFPPLMHLQTGINPDRLPDVQTCTFYAKELDPTSFFRTNKTEPNDKQRYTKREIGSELVETQSRVVFASIQK